MTEKKRKKLIYRSGCKKSIFFSWLLILLGAYCMACYFTETILLGDVFGLSSREAELLDHLLNAYLLLGALLITAGLITIAQMSQKMRYMKLRNVSYASLGELDDAAKGIQRTPESAPQKAHQPQATSAETFSMEYSCPGCRQRLRVQAPKGTIKITCPTCGMQFTTSIN